jgi:hypothetical protein
MNWAVGLVLAFGIILPVGIGLGLGAYRAIQSPAFVGEAASILFKAFFPILKEFVGRRNSPEIEKRMHEVIRRGGKWDNFRKREQLR